jgi:hypothetical protein
MRNSRRSAASRRIELVTLHAGLGSRLVTRWFAGFAHGSGRRRPAGESRHPDRRARHRCRLIAAACAERAAPAPAPAASPDKAPGSSIVDRRIAARDRARRPAVAQPAGRRRLRGMQDVTPARLIAAGVPNGMPHMQLGTRAPDRSTQCHVLQVAGGRTLSSRPRSRADRLRAAPIGPPATLPAILRRHLGFARSNERLARTPRRASLASPPPPR